MSQPSMLEQRIEWTRGFRTATDKTVLKAMARWYCWRGDGTHVRPSNPELAVKCQLPLRTVERALRRLVAGCWLDVIERMNRGRTTYRICVERLATEDPERLRVVTDFDRHNGGRVADETVFDRHSGGRETSGGREIWPESDKVAVEVAADCTCTSTSFEERSGTTTTTTEDQESSSGDRSRHSGGRVAADQPDVDQFFTWAFTAYPQHMHGARLILNRRDVANVAELLHTYALELLEAMTVQLWTLEADANPKSDWSWIARSDRSLRVLYAKAAFLERVVVGVQLRQLTFGPMEEAPLTRREVEEAKDIRTRVYNGCPHDPRCTDYADCVREIALARRIV